MMNVKTKASPLHNNTIVFSKVLFFIKFEFWNLSFNLLTSSLEVFCWLSPYITEHRQTKVYFQSNFSLIHQSYWPPCWLTLTCKMYSVPSWEQRSGGHIGFVTQGIDHQKWNCVSMQKLRIWRQSSHWETKEWRQYWMHWSPKTTHVTW